MAKKHKKQSLEKKQQKALEKQQAAAKKRKRLLIALAAVCACAVVAVGIYLLVDFLNSLDDAPDTTAADGLTEPDGSTNPDEPDDTTNPDEPDGTDKHHVEIEIEDYGTITVELDASAAPITVENFIKLANEGFYNGLTFHRIMEGFMMQGGDPNGDGSGGSPDNIKGEFSNNGVDNPLSHTRGAISMARQGNPYNPASAYDTASSQFFIVHQDSTFLDGDYACFGYVTDGMDIVDKICTEAQPIDDNGTIPAEQQPVITEIRVLD